MSYIGRTPLPPGGFCHIGNAGNGIVAKCFFAALRNPNTSESLKEKAQQWLIDNGYITV